MTAATRAARDENENVKDSYSYSAFGVTLSATSTNGPSTNPMRFVGRWGYYDDTAMGSQGGLSLLGVRYLSPPSGRFLSWDPIRSTNNYDYVRNRSTQLTDPDGRIIPILIGGALIGGACLLIGGCAPSRSPKKISLPIRTKCTETSEYVGATACGAMCASSSRGDEVDWSEWYMDCRACCHQMNQYFEGGYDHGGINTCDNLYCKARKNPCVCAYEME